MEVKIEIKPMRFTASTKDELINKISNNGSYCWICGGGLNYSYLGHLIDENTVRVYNLQKYKTKKKNVNKKHYQLVRKLYWEAFVYDIPIDLLRLGKLRVTQYARNFELTSFNKR